MSPATDWNTHITLEAGPASVRQARHFVTEQLRAHELPDLVDDVGLVTSELTTNAVRYAQTPVTVQLESSADGVRLIVSDDSALNPVQRQPSVWDTRGRGLGIVASISRDWGVVGGLSSAKSVWASFAVMG